MKIVYDNGFISKKEVTRTIGDILDDVYRYESDTKLDLLKSKNDKLRTVLSSLIEVLYDSDVLDKEKLSHVLGIQIIDIIEG